MTTPTTDPLDALIGAAPGPRQWSVTDAADIPRLLERIDKLEAIVRRLLDELDDVNGPRTTALSPGGVVYEAARDALKDSDQ